ncbi:MAG: acyl-CoA dehydrogenase family protein, partial [Alphaproteobacteria bacterium]|nr:acyl-CoA dehydrogenase family protein [Alphaproteobacteria bacterium]
MLSDGSHFLSEEQGMIRDMARDFAARELAPNAAEWDRSGGFPNDIYKRMGALGLMGMMVPEEYGGTELEPGTVATTCALVATELARGDAGIANALTPIWKSAILY